MEFIQGILRLSDLFDGVSDAQLKKLLPFCQEEVYEAGTTIFTEGTPCQTMYIVSSGSVALEMNLPIGRRGSRGSATIGVVTRGSCLCSHGLISPYIHAGTARTLERTELIALDTRVLRRSFSENPKVEATVMNNLAKAISSRLEHTRKTLGHILAVVFHDIKAPLASVESANQLILGGYCGELDKEQKSMLQNSSRNHLIGFAFKHFLQHLQQIWVIVNGKDFNLLLHLSPPCILNLLILLIGELLPPWPPSYHKLAP